MTEPELFHIALSKAMALCSRREYCIEDIRTRLISWKVGVKDIEKILKNLTDEKFIDEKRYSMAYTRDKFKYNKWGKVKIAAHLKEKKITSDKISSALDSIDNEIYIKTIKDLIKSHRKIVKSRSRYEMKGKLMRFGLSKGFESNLLYDIINDIDREGN